MVQLASGHMSLLLTLKALVWQPPRSQEYQFPFPPSQVCKVPGNGNKYFVKLFLSYFFKRTCNCVPIAFPSIVLRAPKLIAMISIAIVVTSGSGLIGRHVDEIGSRVAMASDVTDVNHVAKVLVHEGGLKLPKTHW